MLKARADEYPHVPARADLARMFHTVVRTIGCHARRIRGAPRQLVFVL